jgi:hypothetical protein
LTTVSAGGAADAGASGAFSIAFTIPEGVTNRGGGSGGGVALGFAVFRLRVPFLS